MKIRFLKFIRFLFLMCLILAPAWAQGGATPQTLSWTGTTNEILAQNGAYSLGATASSGLPVKLRVDTGPAVLADGKISVNAFGTVVVTAGQPGDATYSAARLTRSFNVRHAVFSLVGGLATSETLSSPQSVQVVGNYAYVADGPGLQVIDVRNPASPVQVGSYYTDSSGIVQVVGNFAYFSDGWGGLRVIDVSNPAKPVQVGVVWTSGGPQGLQVVGNYAYLANGSGGLQVIDVGNPAKPVRVGGVDTSGEALGLQVMGDYAYLSVGEAGLQVIDIRNPANPVPVGGLDTSGYAAGIQVTGNYAYVADGDAGLQVIDISNPSSPIQAGRYAIQGINDPIVYAVQLIGSEAVLALNGGLQVIDVSNPAKPVLVGAYTTIGSAFAVQVVGNFVYVAEREAGLQIVEFRLAYPQTLAWEGATSEILALNVSRPLRATASSGLPVTLRVESGPAVLTNGMITATGPGNIWITAEQPGNGTYLPAPGIVRSFNVRHMALTKVGVFDTSGYARGVHVMGNYAYVADDAAGLQVIDISNPTRPVRTGEFNSSDFAEGVQVVGNYAYVANSGAGLRVIDISNPATPVRTGEFNTSGVAEGVQVVGNYAYVADGFAGLQVIDISNPAKPSRVGGYVPGLEARGVQVAGSYAYVADLGSGLQVIDVSNPARPVQVAGVSSGSAWDVHVVGNYAYVADEAFGLHVIDVRDPIHPRAAGAIGVAGQPQSVQVEGSYAYVASGQSGLQVIDVSNPARMLLVGEYSTAGQALGVRVAGSYAYVACGTRGLEILQIRHGFPQTLELRLPVEIPFQASPLASAVTSDSGLPITLSVVSGPATVINNQLVLTGLGPVTLRAEQTGDADHLPAVAQWFLTVISRESLPPLSIELVPAGVRLRFIGIAGFRYDFERALAINGPWKTVNSQTVPSSGLIEHLDINPPPGTAFYRASQR